MLRTPAKVKVYQESYFRFWNGTAWVGPCFLNVVAARSWARRNNHIA